MKSQWYLIVPCTAGPQITSHCSISFHYNIDAMPWKLLSCAVSKQPRVKLVLLYVVLLQVAEMIDDVMQGLAVHPHIIFSFWSQFVSLNFYTKILTLIIASVYQMCAIFQVPVNTESQLILTNNSTSSLLLSYLIDEEMATWRV